MNTLKFEPIEIYYNQIMTEFSGVYIFHNVTKNKYYVGQSNNVPHRLNTYITDQSHNKELTADLSTDSFKLALVRINGGDHPFQSLNALENHYIQMFNSNNPVFGYNKTVGNSTKPVQLKIGGPTNPNNLSTAVVRKSVLSKDPSKTVDWYVNFLAKQRVLELPYINIQAEHKRYELWLADNNPGVKPLKSNKFTKDLKNKLLETFGYDVFNKNLVESRVRLSRFNLLQYNNNTVNNLSAYEVTLNEKHNYTFLVNKDNFITDADFETFNHGVKNDSLDLTNPKTLQILYYKIYELKDPLLIAKYGDEL